ncbi:MAG: hypothetical protein ACM3JG_03510, partial [Thiohalocapsa sp.]
MTLALDEPSSLERLDDAALSGGSLLGSLVLVARHRGVHLSKDQLVRDHQVRSDDASVAEILRIAHGSGLRATTTRLRWRDLFTMREALPAILVLRDGGAVVLLAAEDQREAGDAATVLLRHPDKEQATAAAVDEADLAALWDGQVILVKRDYRARDEDRPFGMGWLLRQMLGDRRIVRDLLICAVIVGLLAATPILFWRLMIDRVL